MAEPDDKFVDPASRLVLASIGVIVLLWAAAMVFTPTGMMTWFLNRMAHRHSEMFVASPLLFYMIRTCGALYLWIGISFLVASSDPRRYAPWVRMSAIMLFFLAAVCAIAGYIHHLPRMMWAGDAVIASIGGLSALLTRPLFRGNTEEE